MPHPPSCLRRPLGTLAPLSRHQPPFLLPATPHRCGSTVRAAAAAVAAVSPRRFFFARGCRWNLTRGRRHGHIRELPWRREGSLLRGSAACAAA